jgi:ribosomal protein L11 methyltransferase
MDSIRIEIRANEEKQEELIALLSDLNVDGFEQTEDALITWVSGENFEEGRLTELLGGMEYSLTTVEKKNWNEEWERNFQPVIVGNFCAVRASFHPPVTHTRHEIIITPKMSFGTGHHATTYLMIDQMSRMELAGKNVFDFGTGTGILAILAEKSGATNVLAIDVDEWSVENAKENVSVNNCRNIEVLLSTTIPSEQYDVVLANINRNVIHQYLPVLKSSIVYGGHIIFSGMLKSDEDEMREKAEEFGFHLLGRSEKDNWICLVFRN